MIKTSIRFFDNIPVRAVWDEETSLWWLCAVDIIEALGVSSAPRKYWNTLKSRNPQLSSICRQLKLTAKDGKKYLTDVIDDDGLNLLMIIYSRWHTKSICTSSSRNAPMESLAKL